jgi:hypothetical protein
VLNASDQSSSAWPSIESLHSYRIFGASGRPTKVHAHGKSSGVPGFTFGGMPVQNGRSMTSAAVLSGPSAPPNGLPFESTNSSLSTWFFVPSLYGTSTFTEWA